MALLYSPSLSKLFLGQGILNGFAGANETTVAIFSGPKPSVADFTTNFTNYHYVNGSGPFLAITTIIRLRFVQQPGVLIGPYVNPGNIVASNTGTASWGVMAFNDLQQVHYSPPQTAPQSNRFIILDVGDPSSRAPVRLSTANLVQGQIFQVTDVGFTAQMV